MPAQPSASEITPIWVPLSTTGGVTPHWSPAGSFVLLEEQDISAVSVVAADGRHVGSYDGLIEPAWLTDDTFVAYKSSTMPSNPHREVLAPAVIANVTDGTANAVSFPCCNPIGNGHGAAAVSWFLPYQGDFAPTRFVVWSGGASSEVHAGFATAWARGGDKLLVTHPPRGIAPDGPWEVFGWPGLDTLLASNPQSDVELDEPFDPSGQFVQAEDVVGDGADASIDLELWTLATGDVAKISTSGNHMSSAWTAQPDLLVSDSSGLTTYSTSGDRGSTRPFSGWITGSADGSTVLALDSNNSMSVWPAGSNLVLPTVPESETTFWLSPTGKGLVINSNGGPWLAELP